MSRLPRILLTNDDGFDAPGLAALADIAHEFAEEIWILAPQHDESGTGQSLSLHHPLRCFAKGHHRWAVSGTPADCVAIASAHFMKDAPPSMILSGINAGSNTANDVNLSGTLGAAFMGLMLDIPAIGISQACATRKTARWDTARAVTPKILRHLLAEGWSKDACLSINIPDLPPEKIAGFAWARQGVRTTGRVHADMREDMRGEQYFWMSFDDKDPTTMGDYEHAVIRSGRASVTALTLERSLDVSQPPIDFAPTAKAANE